MKLVSKSHSTHRVRLCMSAAPICAILQPHDLPSTVSGDFGRPAPPLFENDGRAGPSARAWPSRMFGGPPPEGRTSAIVWKPRCSWNRTSFAFSFRGSRGCYPPKHQTSCWQPFGTCDPRKTTSGPRSSGFGSRKSLGGDPISALQMYAEQVPSVLQGSMNKASNANPHGQ